MSNQKKKIALAVENLTIGYSNKKDFTIIASDNNFEINQGSFVALLGKNGIGKSTLLRTLSGVQHQNKGAIFIQGVDKSSIPNIDLSKLISLVLTERLPESQLTVFELVALGRQPYTNWLDKLSEDDKEVVLSALEMTETLHFKNKRYYELSDGQLQRVLIARAIAQDTELIILDEPTAHLDIHHTIKIFSLLKKLVKKTNKTILISSHEVNLSIQLADKLLLMNSHGLTSGTANELIHKNAFESLFPKELVKFDSKLKQFIIEKEN